MGDKKRIFLLIAIMMAVVLIVGGAALGVLYQAAFEQKEKSLVQTAKSQARLIEAIARFDQKFSENDNPGGAVAATLSQIRAAHGQYPGLGETGEFTLARRHENQIVFLLSHRHYDLDRPSPVPFDGVWAEPMRQALSGNSGSLIGLDYRGETVLAAHEPVAVLNLGIVAKVDLSEVRAPFVSAGLKVSGIAFVVISIGTFIFFNVGNPLVRRALKEREWAEEFLNVSEAIIVSLDNAGTVTLINRRGCDVLGYSEDEVVGRNWMQFAIPEDQRELISSVHAQVLSGEGETFEYFENDVLAKDGSLRTIAWHNVLTRNAEGEVTGALCSGQDITRQKEVERQLSDQMAILEKSEENYRVLAALSPAGIFRTDPNGMVTYVNEKWCELGGMSPEDAAGEGWLKALHPDDLAETSQLWDAYTQGKSDAMYRHEQRYLQNDGSVRFCYSQAMREFDGEGNVVGHVGVITDVTALKEALEQADKANKAKSEFLSSMSHELRTPLNAIIGFSSTMMSETFGPVAEKYLDYAGDINRSGSHLLELINDILDVSAIEAGKLELHEEELDVVSVVEATMNMIAGIAADCGVRLHSDCDAGLPALYADKRRVRQILLNLLSNAIKFTPADGVVSLAVSLDDSGAYVFTITDAGVGMDKEEMEEAMAMFGQVDSVIDRRHEGTGLGLPLTQGLVELHNGTLIVDSEKGKGTRITVRLPPERTVYPSVQNAL